MNVQRHSEVFQERARLAFRNQKLIWLQFFFTHVHFEKLCQVCVIGDSISWSICFENSTFVFYTWIFLCCQKYFPEWQKKCYGEKIFSRWWDIVLMRSNVSQSWYLYPIISIIYIFEIWIQTFEHYIPVWRMCSVCFASRLTALEA